MNLEFCLNASRALSRPLEAVRMQTDGRITYCGAKDTPHMCDCVCVCVYVKIQFFGSQTRSHVDEGSVFFVCAVTSAVCIVLWWESHSSNTAGVGARWHIAKVHRTRLMCDHNIIAYLTFYACMYVETCAVHNPIAKCIVSSSRQAGSVLKLKLYGVMHT